MRRCLACAAGLVMLLTACATVQQPRCEGIRIAAVRSAVADVEGYTYTVTGTDTISTFVSDPEATERYRYEDVEFAAEGAYRAPDRGRTKVTRGVLQGPGRTSSTLLGWDWDVEETVRVGTSTWVRLQGAESTFMAVGPRSLVTVQNTLGPLLGGLPFGIELVDAPWTTSSDLRLTWSSDGASGGQCILRGSLPFPSPEPDSARFEMTVAVEPSTSLPAEVRILVEVPGPEAARGFDLTYTFGYDDLPEIEPPTQVGPWPSVESGTPPPG